MRSVVVWLAGVASLGGCGSVARGGADAALPAEDSAADAMIDAVVCVPRMLLVGGTDVEAQGWSIVTQPPATLSYGQDHVRLQTSTATGGRTSGMLLLDHPDAVAAGQPFAFEVVMLVESVSPHNPFDSAAAILGSFSPPVGMGNDRDQMIYLDSGKLGWADDTQSFAMAIQDGAYHTYELSVDAGNVARVRVDGAPALTRAGFVFNGAIALGDQTNDLDVDSALRIRSVTTLCP